MVWRYSKEQIAFIKKHASNNTRSDLTKMFNDRFGTSITDKTMKSTMSNHKIKIGIHNTQNIRRLMSLKQEEFVRKNYIGITNQELSNLINEEFGTNFTTQQIKSFKHNRGLDSGLTSHFEKGHQPINKGTKGMFNVGGNSGSFKKGQKPSNTLPVGSEIMKGDGYLWTKIQESPPKWKQSHVLFWEKESGKIPDGKMLTFLDGDKTNISLTNLRLITQNENIRLNASGYRSNNPEITETGLVLTRTKLKINERKKERSESHGKAIKQ